MSWLAQHLAPLMLLALAPLLMSGVPVFFALAGCGLAFGALGVALGVLPPALVQALPIRLHFIVANETLLAIPFFTLMGMLLQRSGLAEELLDTVGRVFGPVRGGLALAVIGVGALLAATTGVVAASVISMGLISLPAMQRCGYHPRVACGVVAASGSLTQVVPPSLVLIVIADQLGLGVGELYAGVLVPAALLIAGYAAWIGLLAVFRPAWVPAMSPSATTDAGGGAGSGSGHRSLAVLALASIACGALLMQGYPALLHATGRFSQPGADERVLVAIGCGLASAFALASIERVLRLQWLSPLARSVAFVLIPPLLLIYAVLGSIFLGAATPTESGALGALAALALAWSRRRLDRPGLARALLDTSKLSCVVMLLTFGATVFSLTFQAVDGTAWLHGLLGDLPGGTVGFLVVVMALVFVLGCFLDFFELALVLLPILGPVAAQMGIHGVWFAVLMGINLQTSYLTPPFGFALFYLRGAAPAVDTVDDPAAGTTAGTAAGGVPVRRGIRTADIYRGALPFVAVQVIVMALVIAQPRFVLDALGPAPAPLDEAAVDALLREMATRSPPWAAPDPRLPLRESVPR